jgi:hypothetical protein
MKHFKTALLLVILVWALPSRLSALSFGFTYCFSDGSKVTGSIFGEWGADYLQDISGAAWTYYDSAGSAIRGSSVDPGLLEAFGPQLVPVDGGTNGLRLYFETDTNGQFDFSFVVYGTGARVAFPDESMWTQFEKSETGPGVWTLVRPPGVPEEGSILMMVGFSLVVAYGVRRTGRLRWFQPRLARVAREWFR